MNGAAFKSGFGHGVAVMAALAGLMMAVEDDHDPDLLVTRGVLAVIVAVSLAVCYHDGPEPSRAALVDMVRHQPASPLRAPEQCLGGLTRNRVAIPRLG